MMIKNNMFLLIVFLIAIMLSNCSVKAPEVKITGEKTALENQVIGTYEEIEQDSWTIASVRSTGSGNKVKMSKEKKKVLKAVQNRKFNKDDMNEFKRDGIIGENNMGFAEIRSNDLFRDDPELKKRVEKVIAEENEDRTTIMERAIQINEKIAQSNINAISAVFAKIYQDESEPSTWIQIEDNTWVKKK